MYSFQYDFVIYRDVWQNLWHPCQKWMCVKHCFSGNNNFIQLLRFKWWKSKYKFSFRTHFYLKSNLFKIKFTDIRPKTQEAAFYIFNHWHHTVTQFNFPLNSLYIAHYCSISSHTMTRSSLSESFGFLVFIYQWVVLF